MREDDPYEKGRGNHSRPKAETTTFDPFVTAMWKACRRNAPEQDYSGKNFKCILKGDFGGMVPKLKIISHPIF